MKCYCKFQKRIQFYLLFRINNRRITWVLIILPGRFAKTLTPCRLLYFLAVDWNVLLVSFFVVPFRCVFLSFIGLFKFSRIAKMTWIASVIDDFVFMISVFGRPHNPYLFPVGVSLPFGFGCASLGSGLSITLLVDLIVRILFVYLVCWKDTSPVTIRVGTRAIKLYHVVLCMHVLVWWFRADIMHLGN